MPTAPELGPFAAVAVGRPPARAARFLDDLTMSDRSIVRNDTLETGDSGGPLFLCAAGTEEACLSGEDLLVAGVAHAITTGIPSRSIWVNLRDDSLRSWIASRVDRDGGGADVFCGATPRDADETLTSADDADGDWVRDTEDTCPSVYNPCQLAIDSDGDGAPDDCDACAADPMVAALVGEIPDRDGDEVADACDCFPDAALATDNDRDFIVDICDNCTNVANTDQANCDGDSGARSGDACDDDDADTVLDVCGLPGRGDNCLGEPNMDQADCNGDGRGDACDDVDMDGRIDSCGFDNCPGVSNPAQSNCNADAERALGIDPSGDACDAAPCGETSLETRTIVDTFSRRLAMDRIRVDARASSPIDARAGYRFCPCDLATGDDAESRARCEADEEGRRCFLARPELYLEIERLAAPSGWRDATVGSYGRAPAAGAPIATIPSGRRAGDVEALERFALLPDPSRPGASLEIEETNLLGRWAIRDIDEPRWHRVFSPPGTPLVERRWPGVLWTHAPGSSPGDFDVETRERTSHYWSGAVELPEDFPRRPPFPCFRYAVPFVFPDVCIFCDASFPEPFVTLGGIVSAGQCLPGRSLDVFLGFDGGVLPGTSYFAGGPPYFSPELTWVAASEPRAWLPSTGARYVGFDAVLQLVSTILVERDGVLASRVQEPCPNCPPSCPGGPNCPMLAQARNSGDAPERILVLSSRRDTLFAIGGGAIVAIDLARGDAETLPLFDALEAVHAATYAPVDDALYLIEEAARPHGSHTEMRLVRVDPDAGSVDVLARWPRTGWSRRFALAAAEDGSLWIAASGDRGPHVVAWIDPRTARVTVRGIAGGLGVLSPAGARASAAGLSLALDGPTEPRVVGYRAEDVLRTRARDAARCF